ncbi:hypothetical protein AVEN_146772-1 [Araneus ventricosus]|uniref:Uncharacterized protein n=1 Tax=Araneus ventricosus TaxID=182803 RepID=A0A4Y2D8M9_ARAVE|nr:hypothetical protein AVEN_146772-1 [Araneus ventricosus]
MTRTTSELASPLQTSAPHQSPYRPSQWILNPICESVDVGCGEHTRERTFGPDGFNVYQTRLHGGSSLESGFEPRILRPPRLRSYHQTTAASSFHGNATDEKLQICLLFVNITNGNPAALNYNTAARPRKLFYALPHSTILLQEPIDSSLLVVDVLIAKKSGLKLWKAEAIAI